MTVGFEHSVTVADVTTRAETLAREVVSPVEARHHGSAQDLADEIRREPQRAVTRSAVPARLNRATCWARRS